MTFYKLFSFHKILWEEAMKKVNIDLLSDEEKLLLEILDVEDFLKLKIPEEELEEIYKNFSFERKMLVVTVLTKRIGGSSKKNPQAVRDFSRFTNLINQKFPQEEFWTKAVEHFNRLKRIFNKNINNIDIEEFKEIKRLKQEYEIFGYEFFNDEGFNINKYKKLEEKFGV